jgi:hypothetical protein
MLEKGLFLLLLAAILCCCDTILLEGIKEQPQVWHRSKNEVAQISETNLIGDE